MKFTYEQEKSLRRMKLYQREVGIVSIVLWIFTVIMIVVYPIKLEEWFMVPIGAITTVICFLIISNAIRKVENLRNQ